MEIKRSKKVHMVVKEELVVKRKQRQPEPVEPETDSLKEAFYKRAYASMIDIIYKPVSPYLEKTAGEAKQNLENLRRAFGLTPDLAEKARIVKAEALAEDLQVRPELFLGY